MEETTMWSLWIGTTSPGSCRSTSILADRRFFYSFTKNNHTIFFDGFTKTFAMSVIPRQTFTLSELFHPHISKKKPQQYLPDLKLGRLLLWPGCKELHRCWRVRWAMPCRSHPTVRQACIKIVQFKQIRIRIIFDDFYFCKTGNRRAPLLWAQPWSSPGQIKIKLTQWHQTN